MAKAELTSVNGVSHLSEELVSFGAPGSLDADQYRTLRHAVDRLLRNGTVKVIAVTSPAPGDGKTVTALNLAGSFAQSAGARVLVIDADMHRPNVARRLGLGAGECRLEEALLDEAVPGSRKSMVQRIDSLNLSVLLAAGTHPRPYELLTSPRVGALLTEARESFDVILLDTPPAVPFADCRLVARWVDAFLVVVGAHRTPRRLLQETLDVLEPGKVAGVIFNQDDKPLLSAYYHYYAANKAKTDKAAPTPWWHGQTAGPTLLKTAEPSSRAKSK